jgi:hypothetical protein
MLHRELVDDLFIGVLGGGDVIGQRNSALSSPQTGTAAPRHTHSATAPVPSAIGDPSGSQPGHLHPSQGVGGPALTFRCVDHGQLYSS